MLIGLNLLNLVMFGGVVLTRNSIHSLPYQTLLEWFVVPAFAVMIIATVAATGITAAMTLVNAGTFKQSCFLLVQLLFNL